MPILWPRIRIRHKKFRMRIRPNDANPCGSGSATLQCTPLMYNAQYVHLYRYALYRYLPLKLHAKITDYRYNVSFNGWQDAEKSVSVRCLSMRQTGYGTILRHAYKFASVPRSNPLKLVNTLYLNKNPKFTTESNKMDFDHAIQHLTKVSVPVRYRYKKIITSTGTVSCRERERYR
jgi:hypothetical protein